MFYEELEESQRKMNISQHDPTLTTRENTHITSSRSAHESVISFSTTSHPLTGECNIHAWLENCFLMLKYNIILGLFTDMTSYLELSCIFS